MKNIKLCIFSFLLLISLKTYADCNVDIQFIRGYSMPTMSATSMNINKYEGTSVQSAIFSREVSTVNFDTNRVFTNCTVGVMRGIFGNVDAANLTQFGTTNIFRISTYPTFGIKVEMGNAPSAASLMTVRANEQKIYSYGGDSHGLKMRVTLYILPRTSTMSAYPPTTTISNLKIATISVRREDNNALVTSQIPVF